MKQYSSMERTRAMKQFEHATIEALKQGISSDVLTERVLEIEEVLEEAMGEIEVS